MRKHLVIESEMETNWMEWASERGWMAWHESGRHPLQFLHFFANINFLFIQTRFSWFRFNHNVMLV
jgi:hypothetical protein